MPLIKGVVDGFAKKAFGGHLLNLSIQPFFKFIKDRQGLFLPFPVKSLSRQTKFFGLSLYFV